MDSSKRPSPGTITFRKGLMLLISKYQPLTLALFFGPNLKAIENIITKLKGLGYGLTCEEGDETTAFAFLGVSILPDPVTKMLKLTQTGLILKVLAAT
jgi:hypothetical protein